MEATSKKIRNPRNRLEAKKKSAEEESPYGSVAEAMFLKVVERTLDDLRTKLPPDVAPQHMGKWVLDFLDRGAKPVKVRKRAGIFIATCLEKIENNLLAADPQVYREVVVPFWASPDFGVLQEMLFDLRERAEELGLKAKVVQPALRRYLTNLLEQTTTQSRQPAQEIAALAVFGKHGNEVGRRLVVLSNFIKEAGERPTDKDVCKRWDLESIPVPEGWREKFNVTSWMQAYITRRTNGLVHKTISGYMRELGVKSKEVPTR